MDSVRRNIYFRKPTQTAVGSDRVTVVLLVAFAVEVAPVVDVYLAGRLHDVSHVHVWVNLQQAFSLNPFVLSDVYIPTKSQNRCDSCTYIYMMYTRTLRSKYGAFTGV